MADSLRAVRAVDEPRVDLDAVLVTLLDHVPQRVEAGLYDRYKAFYGYAFYIGKKV